jgi:hypothetical protein
MLGRLTPGGPSNANPDHLSRADLIWFRGHLDHGADATPQCRSDGHGDVQTPAIAPATDDCLAEATSGSSHAFD